MAANRDALSRNSNSSDDAATFAFESTPASADDSSSLRDFLLGEPAGGDGGDTAPSERKQRAKRAPRTVRESPPTGESVERDIGLDVRDGIKAMSKSLQSCFGGSKHPVGAMWALDGTEVTLLASPTTRLIKQTSDVASKAASPWWTAGFLATMAAIIVGPRLYFTAQGLKAMKLQAEQQAAVQSAQQQVQQQSSAQRRNGTTPFPSYVPSNDPLSGIVVDRE